MSVKYNCLFCGREIESDIVFEDKAPNFEKWYRDTVRVLSQKCGCTNAEYISRYCKDCESITPQTVEYDDTEHYWLKIMSCDICGEMETEKSKKTDIMGLEL